MARDRVIVRRGTFLDSVALMLVSREAARLDGIEEASIVNATPLNVALLERQGFDLSAQADDLGPNDLVIALRASTEEQLDEALRLIEADLQRESEPRAGAAERAPARSITAASKARSGMNVALISVPGQYAAYESARALDAGMNVFCFSSGPSIEAEVALKKQAAELGLMMMGPDCGTTILGGVSLGFGNAVKPGPVGIVGASGTGIQAVACALDAAGVGISHAIGVGGRDLHRPVGGSMALRAIELLAADAQTEVIVVVAKSPDGQVAETVAAAALASGKGAVFAFPGLSAAGLSLEFTTSLDEAANQAARTVGASPADAGHRGEPDRTPGAIRGLFSGGTLRDEARSILAAQVDGLGDDLPSPGSPEHVLVDLGDERFTQGRAHPMIDPTLRVSMLKEQAQDPAVGVLLLDVVLGYGAHPDPAGELAEAIRDGLERRAGDLSVIAFVCGAQDDPQGLESQVALLADAGVVVTRSNGHAARLALESAGIGGSQ